jgi:hypothetical protein
MTPTYMLNYSDVGLGVFQLATSAFRFIIEGLRWLNGKLSRKDFRNA